MIFTLYSSLFSPVSPSPFPWDASSAVSRQRRQEKLSPNAALALFIFLLVHVVPFHLPLLSPSLLAKNLSRSCDGYVTASFLV